MELLNSSLRYENASSLETLDSQPTSTIFVIKIMNKFYYFFALLLGCGIIFGIIKVISQPPEKRSPAFVLIELGEHPGIRQLQEKIKPTIDQIISTDAIKFELKSRLVLSIFYIGDVEQKNEHLIVEALERDVHGKKIANVKISNEVAFFGEGKNELVVKVIDSSNTLYELREAVVRSLHSLSEQKEQLPFVPHITLGKLVAEKIVEEKTRQQILEAINSVLVELSEDLRKVYSEYFTVYGKERKPLKQFKLE